jgi:hypothetical protein
MNRRSKVVLTTLVPLALGVVFAGLAWACTPADITIDRGMAPPGENVTVTGQYFKDGATVEIFLSTDGSASGRLLGTDRGPQFSRTVTIPSDLAEGSYWVVARTENGEVNAGGGSPQDGEPLEVRHAQPPAEEPEAPPSNGGNPGGNPGNNPGSNPGKNPAQEPGRTGGSVRGNQNIAASDARGGSRTAAGTVIAGGVDARAATGPSGRDARSKNAQPVTSEGTALKPSIEVGGAHAFAGGRAPSLVPDAFDSSFAGDDSSKYLLYGGFLLMIVLMGLGAGFAVAVLERRKATAGVRRDDDRV